MLISSVAVAAAVFRLLPLRVDSVVLTYGGVGADPEDDILERNVLQDPE